MSAKRINESKEYAWKKKEFLEAHPNCFACGEWCHYADRDLHHRRGRSGKLYLDERFWAMACGGMRGCHTKIHQNPGWAIERGYLGGPGEWGVCPP